MSEPLIRTELEDGVFTITLNRPEAMNSMTTALGNRVDEALRLAARDPDVRAVVFTGEGRAFSAGGDIKNLGQVDPLDPLAVKHGNDPRWNDVEMRVQRLNEGARSYDLLRTMPKPTIAMINGPAVGAGIAPALACDLRVMSDRAFLAFAYANMGLSGDVGTNFLLVQAVGGARAREIMMLQSRIEAAEAVAMGLATKVVPHEHLREETMKLARQLANGPTLTLGHIKENINAAIETDARTAFDIEARNFMRCFQTEDHKEAVTAFKEKRKPVFRGR